jgi:NAD(P)-dependent dehydrogenase (short-subunit alcohol dehydrogenase family)
MKGGLSVLLDGKNAVIYGGGGSIGGGVARAFAREGARVFLVGRTAGKLEALAEEIRSAGGATDTAQLDALDEAAVDAHAEEVVSRAGSLDISFNLISHGDVQGTPMSEMRLEDYLTPVDTAVRTTFLTWRAAARHMRRQRSGVILAFGGEGHPPRGYHLGALQTVFHAIEAMRRQLASELGPAGVRVVTLRTGGVPESLPQDFDGREALAKGLADATLLGRAATLEDVGQVAAFVASDRARTMTAATVNVSAGALID